MRRYLAKKLKKEQPAKEKKNEMCLVSWKLSISSWKEGEMVSQVEA